jgi:hypothetical protein
MTQVGSDSLFLAAGLKHFPDARAAVSAFRRVVAEKIEQILNASRPDVWKTTEVKITRSESNGLWVGAGGPMALKSAAGKTLVIDVGIWWKASHFKDPINAVAVVYSATEVLGRRLELHTEVGVRLVRSGSRQDLFFTPLGDDISDVEAAFRSVVEAATDAVATRPHP